jgi:predicted phosphodiesterase
MIYAIFSDIHGNLEALTIAINYIADLGISNILCCGDTVGYGPNPSECFQFLKRYNFVSVAGNHDRAIVKDSVGIYFNEDAVIALNIQRNLLTSNDLSYIKKLPSLISYKNFLLTHSSLNKKTPYQYILDESTARNSLKRTKKHLIFNGHSHVAGVFKLSNEHYSFISGKNGLDIDLDQQFHYIVNVGSVGQPRDGNPELSFCLFDTEAMIVRIVRLPYPIAKTQEKMKQLNFPDFLVQRLNHGI